MLPKGPYNAQFIEPEILKFWLENDLFKPEFDLKKGLKTTDEMKSDERRPFSIVNPPPNAYMRPHIGNVSGYAYQDVFLRYHRLLGDKVLGLPGKDHAGIQGEVVLEKLFWQNKKLIKKDMGREKFYKAAYAHFQKLMPMVMADEQRIGLSSDYSRNLFTLDPRVVETVLGTFVKMFNDKMVYKGVRIVNWDPVAKTTLADIDTERVERETQLVYINYPLKNPTSGKEKFITVATTRAETMLGDTAVIVNPKDKRYKGLIGKTVVLPITDREIPIITSPRVDMKFGTGAVKLTPAHAYDDYVMMNEWNLEHSNKPDQQVGYINVIDKDAKMCGPIPKKYLGLTTDECRKEVMKDLEKLGLIVKSEKHTQSVMVGERSKAIIEQIMSSQWFIDVEKLKKPAIEVVKNGKIKIHPDYMAKKYLNWMENLHDWPVSRSLWWGYRIPVWYKGKPEEIIDKNGQVKVKIGDKEVSDIYDAEKKGLVKVALPRRVVFIPGKHAYIAQNTYPELWKKYPENIYLEVENIDTPTYTDFRHAFEKCNFREDDVIVAHSLGTRSILRYIIDNKIKAKALIMLAPACRAVPREKDKAYAELFSDTKGYTELPKLVKNIYVVYSDNDELMTVEEFKNFVKSIPGAHGVLEHGKRHYDSREYTNKSENLEKFLAQEMREDGDWIQDDDVFDTWFSSGQWVYATLKAHNLMDTFYPTDVMETAYDILELWVSRMIMLSIYTQGEIPFKHVYLHGLVKAPDGQKMSKSKGNVIQPDEIINKYGADALRLLYIVGNKAGAGYPVSYEKLEGHKRFLNKIWNVAKFVLGNLPEDMESVLEAESEDLKLTKDDKTMLTHLDKLVKETTRRMGSFNIGIAAQELYESFWHTFADIYLEQTKSRLYKQDKDGKPINNDKAGQESRLAAQWMLYNSLSVYLRLLHPFVPFITEKIWKEIPKTGTKCKTIMYSNWPK